jgi:predicted cupin superfamily sugar epimerase
VQAPSGAAPTERIAGSAILYMLTSGQVSKLHKIKADECWQFLLGDPITVVELDPVTKQVITTVLGRDILNGQKLFHCVPANRYFGAYANKGLLSGPFFCLLSASTHLC